MYPFNLHFPPPPTPYNEIINLISDCMTCLRSKTTDGKSLIVFIRKVVCEDIFIIKANDVDDDDDDRHNDKIIELHSDIYSWERGTETGAGEPVSMCDCFFLSIYSLRHAHVKYNYQIYEWI